MARPEKRKVDKQIGKVDKRIGKIKHSIIKIKYISTILEIKALDRPKEE